jgi:negative regulator of flagellin synthesis FlgM
MKIDSSFKPNSAPVTTRQQPKAQAENPSPAETVSLSSIASTLQSTEKPPVNAARLQEIKDAITQGRFKINPEAIAGRLIETARDLINTQRRA